MLDDFRQSSTATTSRRRFGSSLGMSVALVIAGGAAAVQATANVRAKEEEKLEQVEFQQAPEPPPPVEEPPPQEAPKPKPKVKKPPKMDVVPKELTDKVLDESDKALTEAGDVGPLDGAGNAPPPPPPPPPPKAKGPVTKPIDSGSNRYDRLKYPPAAQRKGIEGTVVVMFDVTETGTVANAHVVSGPAEFHETVLKAAATWRYTPAKQDGKPIRYKGMTRRVVFRLEDA